MSESLYSSNEPVGERQRQDVIFKTLLFLFLINSYFKRNSTESKLIISENHNNSYFSISHAIGFCCHKSYVRKEKAHNQFPTYYEWIIVTSGANP